jgi:hypothetical protein
MQTFSEYKIMIIKYFKTKTALDVYLLCFIETLFINFTVYV